MNIIKVYPFQNIPFYGTYEKNKYMGNVYVSQSFIL